jgi:hypothetical protein
MPIPRYIAMQFRRPMERGLNRPFLVLGSEEGNPDSAKAPLVVKSNSGFGHRSEIVIRELFALLLARKVGILVPEPVLVRFPDGFEYGAAEHPEFADLIRQSPGWNLATVHLGNSWKPWSNTTPPKSILREDLETAFCFDAMVQNTDRRAENPNLLWKGKQLALIDFDKAFGYIRTFEAEAQPWRKALIQQNLAGHCLHRHLVPLGDGELRGKSLWEAFVGWRVDTGADTISGEIGTGLADPGLDLPLFESYLIKLEAHTQDFFQYLTELSR